MKAWIGKTIFAIVLIHTIVGFVMFRDVISHLAAERFINTVGIQPDRNAAFWFFIGGFSLLIFGGLIDWIERRELELPPFLSWAFLLVTIVGLVMVPASGFWLMLIPIVGMYGRACMWVKKSPPTL
jgi:hypothetical protein